MLFQPRLIGKWGSPFIEAAQYVKDQKFQKLLLLLFLVIPGYFGQNTPRKHPTNSWGRYSESGLDLGFRKPGFHHCCPGLGSDSN